MDDKVLGQRIVDAAVAEYLMWESNLPPLTTQADAHGARCAIRGVMVRSGFYEAFCNMLNAPAQSDAADKNRDETLARQSGTGGEG
jgi:hypothetical protein